MKNERKCKTCNKSRYMRRRKNSITEERWWYCFKCKRHLPEDQPDHIYSGSAKVESFDVSSDDASDSEY